MYPMKMIPAFKDYLWGGERLPNEYGKNTGLRPVAESWEISCHPDGPSTVQNGVFAGKTLPEVIASHPETLGSKCPNGTLPILIKLIDARQELSVQVHPPDEYALRVENESGKNEMWYVLDSLPGSTMILGCKTPVSRDELRDRIENNTILDIANIVPVKAGDCFCVPAGMLHAIGAGVLVAEVQQNSNVTYRVYDYDRRGADGKPRKLHIEKALDVTDTSLMAASGGAGRLLIRTHRFTSSRLTDWEFFRSDLLNIKSEVSICDGESFNCLLVTKGKLTLEGAGEGFDLDAGESAFIPANTSEYRLSGKGEAILTLI